MHDAYVRPICCQRSLAPVLTASHLVHVNTDQALPSAESFWKANIVLETKTLLSSKEAEPRSSSAWVWLAEQIPHEIQHCLSQGSIIFILSMNKTKSQKPTFLDAYG